MNKERITDAELSEIRERVDKATAGNWKLADTTDGAWLLDDADMIIAGTFERIEDAIFSAHARQDIPKLLEEIGRYRESVRGIKEKIELNDERMRELKREPQYYDPKGKIDTMNGQAHGLETALEIIGSDSE